MKFTNNKLSWNNYKFFLKNESVLSSKLVNLAIDNFFNTKVNILPADSHLIILFRIVTGDNIYKTIGKLRVINTNEKSYYKEYIQNFINFTQNNYSDTLITKIVFSYGIREGTVPANYMGAQEKPSIYQNYRHYKLPVTNDVLQFGKVIRIMHEEGKTIYILHAENSNVFIIEQSFKNDLYENKVKVSRNGDIVLEFIDKQINSDKFVRIINNNHYIYNLKTGELELFYVEKPTKFISTIKTHDELDSDFITLDIETGLISNTEVQQHQPYLISFYDGKESFNFFITDYDSVEDMFKDCIDALLVKKYQGYKIYVHNLANFDAIFLLKALVENADVKPIINNGRIISINVSRGKNGVKFLDSYQILLSSLKKLSLAFETDDRKDIFPFEFINREERNYNYVGPVPKIEYFPDSVSQKEYIDYANRFNKNNWSLKQEAINYCQLDCISLYQVMDKFSNMIFDKWSLNITNYPTITSLTFAIFRAHYLKPNMIPMISGQIFKDIKLSYTGGATDMYLPTNIDLLEDEDAMSNLISNESMDLLLGDLEPIYCYDVNSLYPFVMKNNKLPTGKIFYFEGDITKLKPNKLGFYYVKVTAPINLDHPIIQLHHNNCTLSPTGTFEMMIYSEEMKNAKKYGYKFEILRGYYFEGKEIIFHNYIKQLYSLRLLFEKGDPMNFIAKILMNSLYGRFGMDSSFSDTNIITNYQFEDMMKNLPFGKLNLIEDITNIGDSHIMISKIKDETDTMLNSIGEVHNINIALASSITSLARVHMSKFKNNPHIKLYYTDTDSIFINLDENQLNNLFNNCCGFKIGQMKLEYKINKAIFLGPKAYYLELDNEKKIVKIKGLNSNVVNNAIFNELTFNNFFKLLYKGEDINLYQNKWFKNLTTATIQIMEQSYNIKHNENKRQLIYNDKSRLINTKPYHISNNSNNDEKKKE